MPSHEPRIVSLLPAATEMVALLDAEQLLVGVSHECDHPPGVRTRPRLSAPGVPIEGDSLAIDRAVRSALAASLSLYALDEAGLKAARPDVLITQDLCEVCAVPLVDVRRAVDTLFDGEVRLVSLNPARWSDVLGDLRRVGAALGRDELAEARCAELEARVEAVHARARALASRPRVLTIEWIEPTMIGGTWMPELVEFAGGEALVTRAGEPAATLAPDALAELEPDVVLFKPCGFDLARSRAELATIERIVRAADWPATRTGEVYVADGNAYFNRPGPRLVESLEILAACLHPRTFADLGEKHAASFARLCQFAEARSRA